MLQDNVNYGEGMPCWIAEEILKQHFSGGRQPDLADENLKRALATFDNFQHYELQRILFDEIADRIHEYRKNGNGRQVL